MHLRFGWGSFDYDRTSSREAPRSAAILGLGLVLAGLLCPVLPSTYALDINSDGCLAELGRVLELRRQEKVLIQLLDPKTDRFSQPEKRVTRESIRRLRHRARRRIHALGIEVKRIDRRGFRGDAIPSMFRTSVTDDGLRTSTNSDVELYEVVALPPAIVGTHPIAGNGFFHPLAQTLFERLQRLGVRLVIDVSEDLATFGGIYMSGEDDERLFQPSIALPINPDLLLFIHETAHAEFDAYKIESFITKVRRRPRAAARLMSQKPYRQYGEARLAKVVELLERGYDVDAINERMSVIAELDLDKGQFVEDGEEHLSPESHKYAEYYVLRGLLDTGRERMLSNQERAIFAHSWTLHRQWDPKRFATPQLRSAFSKYVELHTQLLSPEHQDWALRAARRAGSVSLGIVGAIQNTSSMVAGAALWLCGRNAPQK